MSGKFSAPAFVERSANVVHDRFLGNARSRYAGNLIWMKDLAGDRNAGRRVEITDEEVASCPEAAHDEDRLRANSHSVMPK